jgi:single-strand DNA-binding protein
MASFNKVVLIGNLTRDPVVRQTAGGTAVADVGLAVNRKYKSNDEWKEETTFVDITVWGKQAELCGEYLSKGRSALFEGRLKLDSWEDKEGNKRNKLGVVAESVQFLGSPKDSGSSAVAKADDKAEEAPAEVAVEGTPF